MTTIMECSDTLLKLISDVLELSRIESAGENFGQLVNKQNFDVVRSI